MSTVTITSIFRKDVETRFGIKPKVGIKTQEHGDKWLSTFKTKGTEDWTEGMTVQIEVSESGDFLNFNPVGGAKTTASASPALEARVKKLEDTVFGVKTAPADVVVDEETLDSEF